MRSLPAVQFLTLDASAYTPVEQAELACQGGVRWVQLRAKGLSLDAWILLASQVVAVAHAHGAICTINDSPEVALASAADGVHLGKNDPSPAAARKLLGPHKLIGVTLNSLDDLWRTAEGAPDYVGVGMGDGVALGSCARSGAAHAWPVSASASREIASTRTVRGGCT